MMIILYNKRRKLSKKNKNSGKINGYKKEILQIFWYTLTHACIVRFALNFHRKARSLHRDLINFVLMPSEDIVVLQHQKNLKILECNIKKQFKHKKVKRIK